MSFFCFLKVTCKVCNKKHHVSINEEKDEKTVNQITSATVDFHFGSNCKNELLQPAVVEIKNFKKS